jgi:predicted aspartyl protease
LAALCAQTPSPAPSVVAILARHQTALAALHLRDVHSYVERGTIDGLGLHGEFREWQDGDRVRRDEILGIRRSTTLRIGASIWIKDENGAVRALRGIALRRQVTEDFIEGAAFTQQPQYSTFAGTQKLADGRTVDLLDVKPPGGEAYRVGIDTATGLIDLTSYDEHDMPDVTIYQDQRVVDGLLVPYVEIESTGDRAYDVTDRVDAVATGVRLDPAIFAPLVALTVTAAHPVTVPYVERDGLMIVAVQISGKTYHLLVDSGSQADVIDTGVARELGLHPQGILEIRGAKRTPSGGVATISDMSIGGVALPMRVVTVVDLDGLLNDQRVDGILGYPLFDAADVRIDPAAKTLTIAAPGTLSHDGARIDVDTDREVVEAGVRVDGEPMRALLDTGDGNELLLFQSFMRAHPGLIMSVAGGRASDRGIGGSLSAAATMVSDLEIGPYHLYNRRATVVLEKTGAFADRNVGGNVGYASLRNFVLTFQLSDGALYVKPDGIFDDGRFRPVREPPS